MATSFPQDMWRSSVTLWATRGYYSTSKNNQSKFPAFFKQPISSPLTRFFKFVVVISQVQHLAEALCDDTKIESLELGVNTDSDVNNQMDCIGEMLRNNNTLEEISTLTLTPHPTTHTSPRNHTPHTYPYPITTPQHHRYNNSKSTFPAFLL